MLDKASFWSIVFCESMHTLGCIFSTGSTCVVAMCQVHAEETFEAYCFRTKHLERQLQC